MWGELNKFDHGSFATSNRLIFAPPWGDEQIQWWRVNMYAPHGIYPDDLGEMLSASIDEPKVVPLIDMNPKSNSFVIRVKGSDGDTGEVWWHQRALDLSGSGHSLSAVLRLFVRDLIDECSDYAV